MEVIQMPAKHGKTKDEDGTLLEVKFPSRNINVI